MLKLVMIRLSQVPSKCWFLKRASGERRAPTYSGSALSDRRAMFARLRVLRDAECRRSIFFPTSHIVRITAADGGLVCDASACTQPIGWAQAQI